MVTVCGSFHAHPPARVGDGHPQKDRRNRGLSLDVSIGRSDLYVFLDKASQSR